MRDGLNWTPKHGHCKRGEKRLPCCIELQYCTANLKRPCFTLFPPKILKFLFIRRKSSKNLHLCGIIFHRNLILFQNLSTLKSILKGLGSATTLLYPYLFKVDWIYLFILYRHICHCNFHQSSRLRNSTVNNVFIWFWIEKLLTRNYVQETRIISIVYYNFAIWGYIFQLSKWRNWHNWQ